jgi:hypothetical protein
MSAQTKTLNRSLGLAVLAAALFTGQSASAQTLIAPGVYAYTTLASYDAATFSDEDSITFNGLYSHTVGYTAYYNPTPPDAPLPVVTGGVNFSVDSGSDLYVIGPNFVSGSGFDFANSEDGTPSGTLDPESDLGGPATTTLTATLPTDPSPEPPITSVGTLIAPAYTDADITVTINFDGAPSVTHSFPLGDGTADGLSFLGFTGPDAITSIVFNDSTEDSSTRANLVLDDFTYGFSNVPEPATYALLGLGALALVIFRRRLVTL